MTLIILAFFMLPLSYGLWTEYYNERLAELFEDEEED